MATPPKPGGATPAIKSAQLTTLNDPYTGKSPQSPDAVSKFQQRMNEIAAAQQQQQQQTQASSSGGTTNSGTSSTDPSGSITGSADGDQLAQQYMQQVEQFYAGMGNFGSGTRVEIDQSDDTPDPAAE